MGPVRKELEQSEHLAPARFGTALILIALAIFGFAFSGDTGWNGWVRVLSLFAEGAALLFIVRMSERGLVLRVARVAVVVAVAAAIVSIWLGEGDTTTIATAAVGALMAIAAPIAIVRRLSQERVVDLQVLAGAMCLYLLIGLFFAFVYKAIGAIDSRPLFVQTTDPSTTVVVYFSYVTLSTVGYGDYTVAQDGVKMLAVTEMLLGQLYLVSAVALVVSQFGRGRTNEPILSRRRSRTSAATDEEPGSDPDAPADP